MELKNKYLPFKKRVRAREEKRLQLNEEGSFEKKIYLKLRFKKTNMFLHLEAKEKMQIRSIQLRRAAGENV